MMNGYERHAIPAATRHGFMDGLNGRPMAERAWPADIMPHYRAGYQQGRIAAHAPAMEAALRGMVEMASHHAMPMAERRAIMRQARLVLQDIDATESSR